MQTFSERLKWLVAEFAGGIPAKFAKKIGIKQGTLHPYLKGRIPKAAHLISIHKILNVNLNWLLAGEGEPFGVATGKDKDQPLINKDEISPPIDQAVLAHKMLDVVLDSNDLVLKRAIISNLEAFSGSVDGIERLRQEMAELRAIMQGFVKATTSGGHDRRSGVDRRQINGLSPTNQERRSGHDRRSIGNTEHP